MDVRAWRKKFVHNLFYFVIVMTAYVAKIIIETVNDIFCVCGKYTLKLMLFIYILFFSFFLSSMLLPMYVPQYEHECVVSLQSIEFVFII